MPMPGVPGGVYAGRGFCLGSQSQLMPEVESTGLAEPEVAAVWEQSFGHALARDASQNV